jgi:hypothetical protein
MSHADYAGCKRCGLRRPFAVLKRHVAVALAALHRVPQVQDVGPTLACADRRCCQHCGDDTAHATSLLLRPRPCLGVEWTSRACRLRWAPPRATVAPHAAAVQAFPSSRTRLSSGAFGH